MQFVCFFTADRAVFAALSGVRLSAAAASSSSAQGAGGCSPPETAPSGESGGNAHRCLSSRLPTGTSPEVNATDGSDSSASGELLILTEDDSFPVELTLSRKLKNKK